MEWKKNSIAGMALWLIVLSIALVVVIFSRQRAWKRADWVRSDVNNISTPANGVMPRKLFKLAYMRIHAARTYEAMTPNRKYGLNETELLRTSSKIAEMNHYFSSCWCYGLQDERAYRRIKRYSEAVVGLRVKSILPRNAEKNIKK